MKKVFIVSLAALVALALIVGFWARWQVTLAWPQVDGQLQLAGLQDEVTVIRDKRGVPHIYASNAHDLFMAQGFIHAQDRFWQMEFWRRIGMGRLSELFGPASLEQDRFLRTLGLVPVAQMTFDALDADTKAALEAYAGGVNAYIEQNSDRLPLEFRVLGLTGVNFTPEPWTPINTLTWLTLMSFELGGNYRGELRRAQLMDRFGETWMRELMDIPYDQERPSIVSQDIDWRKLNLDAAISASASLSLASGEGIGSNNWVVSGDLTDTGAPILANDPHLSIQMPSIWYENGLHCQPVGADCPYNVVGFSFASAPGVIIGHNDAIAWGVTNVGPDVQDLYVEKLNPENPNQYLVNGEWRDIMWREELIYVAGQEEPERLIVRETRHGPIINDLAPGSASDWTYGWQPLALQWTALGVNRVAQSVLLLNQARDWESFRRALTYWDAPSQNFIYADREGNIGYQMPGLIPLRVQGDGGLPVPGWNDDYAWTGFIPFDELPRTFNPPEGYIVTANNQVVGPDYPYLISKEWAPGYRAQRIVDLIESADVLSVETMKQIQGDNANLVAGEVIPYLRDAPLERPDVAAQRDKLLAWDLQQDPDSAEAAFYEAFYYHLIPLILEDELGDLTPGYGSSSKRFLVDIIDKPESHWWDDVSTPQRETRDQILAKALGAAYDDLSERLGPDPEKWRWGDLHTATFRNQTLGQSGIAPIEAIFNRGPQEVGGGNAIVNATAWGGKEPNPFEVVWLPSLRMIVDMADLSRSLAINTTGQSGHPYHPHYDDQIEMWAAVQYAPMLWRRDQVEADAEGTLILTP
ncbi:MAG: penicillin acylase family protein [Chloroflexi bacterium]|nr:penicillin acylase family protein [Chloroflexota bacterium]